MIAEEIHSMDKVGIRQTAKTSCGVLDPSLDLDFELRSTQPRRTLEIADYLVRPWAF